MTQPDPEATGADVAEQRSTPTRDAAPAEVPLGAPEADVLEQSQAVSPGEHGDTAAAARDLPLEADPADAAEQAVVVDGDEDDYR